MSKAALRRHLAEHAFAELYLDRATVLRGYIEELCQQSACSDESAKKALDGLDALITDLNAVAADAEAAAEKR
jgi:hypothetical protein